MKKIGILTFHYSNNYGGVLQAISLQKKLEALGYEVEIINYIPSDYKPNSIYKNLNLKRLINNKFNIMEIGNLFKKINIRNNYNSSIISKFDSFRNKEMNLSRKVNEKTLASILNNYSAIIVGSDQIWNPSQRNSPIYFLDYNEYKGKKISYAADSTTATIDYNEKDFLESSLRKFHHISVRNEHSFEFVKILTDREPLVVADPTLLLDLEFEEKNSIKEDYILVYILGKEIEGSHIEVIKKIKEKYGDLPVYSIKIPTMNFEFSTFADKVFYDLDPQEWLKMFHNARFVYTDSFHGVLYSLKYHKPFLAYYTEKLRATRFLDLSKRYGIGKYIVENTFDIENKKSLDTSLDFNSIDDIIKLQKNNSLDFIKTAIEE